MPLIGMLHSFVYPDFRYDLNALFKKQMGFMTVNVQGLSRVSHVQGVPI